MVEDENGGPIKDARVWVLGNNETVITGITGSFSLNSHAADGQPITLVAKEGNRIVQTPAFAGRTA